MKVITAPCCKLFGGNLLNQLSLINDALVGGDFAQFTQDTSC